MSLRTGVAYDILWQVRYLGVPQRQAIRVSAKGLIAFSVLIHRRRRAVSLATLRKTLARCDSQSPTLFTRYAVAHTDELIAELCAEGLLERC
jgi:hypothetical protein